MDANKFSQIEVTNTSELKNWLEKNHASEESFWLVTYKIETRDKYISREEVLDLLVAYG